MADLADLAQAQIDMATSVALNKKNGYTGESAHYCCECDEPIPEKRRKLIKGCQRCVDCQQLKEHRR
ncbi:TraR/DksA C4-type zinc finger protein [Gilliamella sp. B2865]|uniref:TraR/DksA C4-type zinc finger protein n=1 Tax=Gilliamella sp. B2865 TaxID=2817984 RepID=UPI002B49AD6A|nr:TraR/DksA C4-type zinc finger protein [Gilliamella sp. B2865]MCX8678590.1 TraR/DksA C4-type zinc finger protein [Gilliamella sp. B2865]